MENSWALLRNAVMPILIEEPDVEGLLWPLYLMRANNAKSFPPVLFFIRDMMRKRTNLPIPERTLWYAVHGNIPSHIGTIEGVAPELNRNNVDGLILGPHPFNVLHICTETGWPQISWDCVLLDQPRKMLYDAFVKSSALSMRLQTSLQPLKGRIFPMVPHLSTLRNLVYGSLKWAAAIRHLLATHRPNILFAGTDTGFILNPLFRITSGLGVPSVVLQHGNQGEYSGTVHSDFVAVWGDYYRQRTVSFGAPPEIIKVLGSPRLDNEVRRVKRINARERVRKELGVNDSDILVLHISDGDLSHLNRADVVAAMVKEIPTVLAELSSHHLVIVKLHPGEMPASWEGPLAGSSCRIMEGSRSIYELFDASDIVTCVSSVAGLEAAFFGKPVVFWRPLGEVVFEDFAAAGIGLGCNTTSAWIKAVEHLSIDRQYRESVVSRTLQNVHDFITNRGESSDKIAEMTRDILSSNNPCTIL